MPPLDAPLPQPDGQLVRNSASTWAQRSLLGLAVVAFIAGIGVWVWIAGNAGHRPRVRPPEATQTAVAKGGSDGGALGGPAGPADQGTPAGNGAAGSAGADSGDVVVIDEPAAHSGPNTSDLFHVLLAEPPPRDPVALAVRMGRTSSPPPRMAVSPRSAGHAVGETDRFWVHDIEAERYFSVTARLEVLTDNATFWVQQGLPFNREDLKRGAEEFAGKVIPKLRAAFGSEWSPGIDNDPRVVVLHHQNIAGVAGYFSSPDEFTRLVEPYSNEHEMFNINLSAARPGSFEYLALLSHEFQHMIHWNTDPDESVWANEGLSELAPHLVGYGQQTGSAYLGGPDTPLLEWETQPHENAAHYAAAYLYFAYLRAQYGDAVLKAFDAAQPNGPNGVEAALRSLGHAASFEETFLDWVAANAVHDELPATVSAVSGSRAPRFSYGDQDVETAHIAPLAGASVDETVGQFATDYWDVTRAVSDSQLTLAFSGAPLVSLLGAAPNAEGHVWWSGRGENMDSRLTRAFDLSGVKQARLDFKMWYDIEENWDFAYFLASTDDGAHWQRLSTKRTTDQNPNGNNYGHGLTGESGGWVDESLDLSPFAGQRVLVSFEVMTDDAVSQTGLAVDDLQLEAVGFKDDVEGGAAGWLAEGFRVVDPRLPQGWGVQAIVIDEGANATAASPTGLTGQDGRGNGVPGDGARRTRVSIRRFAAGSDGTATIHVDAVPGSARVLLAISGLTPATREAARYQLKRLP